MEKPPRTSPWKPPVLLLFPVTTTPQTATIVLFSSVPTIATASRFRFVETANCAYSGKRHALPGSFLMGGNILPLAQDLSTSWRWLSASPWAAGTIRRSSPHTTTSRPFVPVANSCISQQEEQEGRQSSSFRREEGLTSCQELPLWSTAGSGCPKPDSHACPRPQRLAHFSLRGCLAAQPPELFSRGPRQAAFVLLGQTAFPFVVRCMLIYLVVPE